jgi:hypothetical protein
MVVLAFAVSSCTTEVSGPAGVGGASGTGGSGGTAGSAASSGGGTGGSGATDPGTRGVAASTRVARLTHRQYANTVRDLFGIADDVTSGFAPDALNGFAFDTSVDLRVDARLGPQYRTAAEALAERSVSEPSVFERVVGCVPSDASCADAFIRGFGLRAFRRPLADADVARFRALFDQGAALIASGDAFRDGVRVVVEAMLQTPQFLYRAELESTAGADELIALDGYEIASRLSYLIWDSMPDAALFELAASGGLGTPEAVQTAAERMLSEPRALEKKLSFHEQALSFSRFARITPDPETYPGLPVDFVDRVRLSSRRYVEEVVQNGGGLRELLTAPYAFADSALAPLYGRSVGGGLERIDFTAGERKGYLMQVGFLASHAYAIKTDPIHRGLFVLRDVLCREIQDPPPGASQTELPAGETPPTTRDEVTLLTSGPTCLGCHIDINAPGFAFEGFDAVGAARTTENGVAVDTSGELVIDGENFVFADAAALVERLAGSVEAQGCYAARYLEFAHGRDLAPQDAATRTALTGPYSADNLVMRIATSEAFRMRPVNEVGP